VFRQELLDSLHDTLRATFGGIHPVVPHAKLAFLFSRKDYVGLVSEIAQVLCVDLHLFVALVKSGGPAGAPAWVNIPSPMPQYGTREYKETRINVFLRNEFLATAPFETLVFAIAHELAHILLHGLHHPLRSSEEATDLTAMILGFAEYYKNGAVYKVGEQSTPVTEAYFAVSMRLEEYGNDGGKVKVGYLSPEEIGYLTARIQQK
jgi:hypothetical protein